MPSSKSIAQIKSSLLHPATTSHFEVMIDTTKISNKYLKDNGVDTTSLNAGKLNLLCSEANLPGSNLATLELTNDHTGVTERHAYRRVYDDRMDMTFYVDAENYLPIRFFETWMKFIANESIAVDNAVGVELTKDNYNYRFKYRDDYAAEGFEITKFEKSMLGGAKGRTGNLLNYKFIKAFPISISSMPVSYDSSSLLKCTVSMTYMRYFITDMKGEINTPIQNQYTPETAARINSLAFNPNTNLGIDYGNYTTTGGVTLPSALSSGNTINIRNSFGSSSTIA